MAYVNGFAYKAVRPVAEDQVLSASNGRRRPFKRKFWREQLRDWNETFKPTSIRAHRELQSVDQKGSPTPTSPRISSAAAITTRR